MLATRMRMAASAAVGGGANWWEAGGASGAIAAYQPIGAASLAASYANLANPGTFDAAPGVAPTWNATNGWIFDGTTQYLATGVVPVNNQQWSAIVRYSDYANASNFMLGANEVGNPRFYIGRSGTNQQYANGAQVVTAVASPSAGVQAFAGTAGYMDGAFVVTLTAAAGTATKDMYIGARNNNGGVINFANIRIQAVAIYSSPLTADQVAAVSAAMAAL